MPPVAKKDISVLWLEGVEDGGLDRDGVNVEFSKVGINVELSAVVAGGIWEGVSDTTLVGLNVGRNDGASEVATGNDVGNEEEEEEERKLGRLVFALLGRIEGSVERVTVG